MNVVRFLNLFWVLLPHVCFGVLAAQGNNENCNICGPGNSIQYPQGVVDFVYEGNYRKNNCQRWQDIVNNNQFAISPEFCRNEMLQYTYRICRCTTPDGKAVEWVPPTLAPSSSAPTTAYPTSGAEIGVGAPTELPLEWITPSTSEATPSPVVIPTVSIGEVVTAPPTSMIISNKQPTENDEPLTSTSNDNDETEASGQIQRRTHYVYLCVISVLVLLSA